MKTKKIFLFILLSLVIAGIYIYPDLKFRMAMGKDYRGIALTCAQDEPFYLARINRVYQGDYNLDAIGNYEHRNDPWVIPPFSEILLGLFGKAIGLSVIDLDILLSAIFPVIIFWLIAYLVFLLTDSLKAGILGGFAIIFGFSLFSLNPALWRSILRLNYDKGLWFLRPVSPQFHFIIFIFSLISVIRVISSKRIKDIVFLGVSLGALFYVSYIYWMYLFAGLFILCLIYFLKKDKAALTALISSSLIALIISIPFWRHYLKIISLPSYHFFLQKAGVIFSRRPYLSPRYLLPSAFILMLIRKARKETLYYLASFLVAGLICQNQQIITGEYITDVYTRIYLGKTFLIVSVVTGLAVYLKKITAIRPRAIKILNLSIYLIIFIFMVYGILEQHNYYRHNYKTIQGYQNFAGAFRWLKANTSPRDVILTDPVDDHDWELWKLMILYTNNNFYLSLPSGSLISKEETEKRYLYAMRYFGYSLTDARGFFSKRPTFFVGLSASRAYNPDFDAALYTEELARKYELLFNKEPLGLLREFKVDLIFVKRPALRKGSTRYLNAVYQDNFVEIYALK